MDAYEQGRNDARSEQQDTSGQLLEFNSPEWQDAMDDLVEDRDRMAEQAAQGNTAAALQKAYLDGFLSAWD